MFRRSADGIFPTQNYSAVGIFPTRSRSFSYWDYPHSEAIANYFAAGIFPTQSQPFLCWDFPYSETTRDCSAVGIFLTWRIVSRCSADGIPPLGTTLLLSFSLLGVSPSVVGIFPLGSDCKLLCCWDFPTRRPLSSLRCWDFPHLK